MFLRNRLFNLLTLHLPFFRSSNIPNKRSHTKIPSFIRIPSLFRKISLNSKIFIFNLHNLLFQILFIFLQLKYFCVRPMFIFIFFQGISQRLHLFLQLLVIHLQPTNLLPLLFLLTDQSIYIFLHFPVRSHQISYNFHTLV